ncbi:hypothetical protein BsWGS_05623 [Bradybaena similaris]
MIYKCQDIHCGAVLVGLPVNNDHSVTNKLRIVEQNIDWVTSPRQDGYAIRLLTIEVGARDVISNSAYNVHLGLKGQARTLVQRSPGEAEESLRPAMGHAQ